MRPLKSLLLKYRTNLIVVFSLLFIAIAIMNIYYSVEVNVRSNDECLWIGKKELNDSTVVYFDFVKVDGVAWNAGIRDGDQLIEIDGKPIRGTFQAQSILDKFNYGEYADYKYARDGKIFTTKVYVKKLVEFDWLAGALSALFWMLIGFIVLTSKPDGRIHRLFYLLGVLFVFISLNVHMPMYGDYIKFFNENGFISAIIVCFWLLGLSFAPFLFNYFFWNFPNQFNFAQKSWVKKAIVIAPSMIFVSFSTLFILLYFKIVSLNTLMVVYNYQYFYITANVTALIALIVQYRRIKVVEKKKNIRKDN